MSVVITASFFIRSVTIKVEAYYLQRLFISLLSYYAYWRSGSRWEIRRIAERRRVWDKRQKGRLIGHPGASICQSGGPGASADPAGRPSAIPVIGAQTTSRGAPDNKSKRDSSILTEVEPLLLLLFGLILFAIATGIKLKLSRVNRASSQ
jgi:hypothetical protein